MKEFNLPDPGEGLTEAEIVTWRVAEGDVIKVNDVLVEIETAKSVVELPSPFAGRVAKILVPEGDEVAVGTPIVQIDDGPDAGPTPEPPAAQAAAETEAPGAGSTTADPATEANLVGYGARAGSSARRPRRQPTLPASAAPAPGAAKPAGPASPPAPAPAPASAAPAPDARPSAVPATPAPATPAPTGGARPLAKPPVRKLARDRGVDLAGVAPTGSHGEVTRDDVLAAARSAEDGVELIDPSYDQLPGEEDRFTDVFAQGRSQAVSAWRELGAQQPPAEEESGAWGRSFARPMQSVQQLIKGVRRATAQNMVNSAKSKVMVTEWVDVDVTRTVDLIEALRERREFRELKVTPTLIVAQAAVLALSITPEMNASWDEDNQVIIQHGMVNLGIAAATPRGLLVPNIKNAERLGLLELCRRVNDLVAVARSGKLQPPDYAGGTFTLTNVGVFGIDGGTPIINGTETGILAMGRIMRRPWVVGHGAAEHVEIRSVMTLSLGFDHRIIDGEGGSTFLRNVADILHEPGLALPF